MAVMLRSFESQNFCWFEDDDSRTYMSGCLVSESPNPKSLFLELSDVLVTSKPEKSNSKLFALVSLLLLLF